jgi:hypothetical protein
MDGDDLVAYGDVDALPADAEDEIGRLLAEYPIERYPEGALIGTFAPPRLEPNQLRDPEAVSSDPYPREIELSEFPPEEGRLYWW